MKRVFIFLCFLVLATARPAFALDPSAASSNASVAASQTIAVVVSGSASVLAAGSILTVMAVEKTGEAVVLILKGASETATVSVRIGTDLSGQASVALGTTVSIVAESTGQALVASGKIIGFIPNAVGQSLIHHSRITQ